MCKNMTKEDYERELIKNGARHQLAVSRGHANLLKDLIKERKDLLESALKNKLI